MMKDALLKLDLDGCKGFFISISLPKKYVPKNGFIDVNIFDKEYRHLVKFEGYFENCFIDQLRTSLDDCIKVTIRQRGN